MFLLIFLLISILLFIYLICRKRSPDMESDLSLTLFAQANMQPNYENLFVNDRINYIDPNINLANPTTDYWNMNDRIYDPCSGTTSLDEKLYKQFFNDHTYGIDRNAAYIPRNCKRFHSSNSYPDKLIDYQKPETRIDYNYLQDRLDRLIF